MKNDRATFSVCVVYFILAKIIGDKTKKFSSRPKMVTDGRFVTVFKEVVEEIRKSTSRINGNVETVQN